MEFNINEFLEKYGIKKILLILIFSFILFLFVPNNFINYLGNKISTNEDIQKIIIFVFILSIVTLIVECLFPLIFEFYKKFKRKNIILKLDDNYKEILKLFYDDDLRKYNKVVTIENKNKYIDSLNEIGIIEYIVPIIITRNTKEQYRVSNEYRDILDNFANKNKV